MNYFKYIFTAFIFFPLIVQATLEQDLAILNRSLHTLLVSFGPQSASVTHDTKKELLKQEQEKQERELLKLLEIERKIEEEQILRIRDNERVKREQERAQRAEEEKRLRLAEQQRTQQEQQRIQQEQERLRRIESERMKKEQERIRLIQEQEQVRLQQMEETTKKRLQAFEENRRKQLEQKEKEEKTNNEFLQKFEEKEQAKKENSDLEERFSELVSQYKQESNFTKAIDLCEKYFSLIQKQYFRPNYNTIPEQVKILLKEVLELNADSSLSIGEEKKIRILLEQIAETLKRKQHTLIVSYYKIIGLNPNASGKEIQKAYKKFAIKWHPDRNSDDKEEATLKFKEISNINELLTAEKGKYKEWYDAPHEWDLSQWIENYKVGYAGSYAYDYLKHQYISAYYHEKLLQDGFVIVPSDSVFYDEFKEYPQENYEDNEYREQNNDNVSYEKPVGKYPALVEPKKENN